MHVGRPERLRNVDHIGFRRYFLTFCTDRRQPFFTKERAVSLVLSQISRAATDEKFSVIAYCFMPDHLHLLIEGFAENSDCRAFISRSRQFSGYYYSKEFKARLWQPYGYEHVLRNDEATFAVARYILDNPIRAGLVTRVSDYPFVGSFTYDLKDLLNSLPEQG